MDIRIDMGTRRIASGSGGCKAKMINPQNCSILSTIDLRFLSKDQFSDSNREISTYSESDSRCRNSSSEPVVVHVINILVLDIRVGA